MTESTRRPNIVIAQGIFPDVDRIGRTYGDVAQLRYADLSSMPTLAAATQDADALVISTQMFDAARLAVLPAEVRVISRSGVGLDAIDLLDCDRLGITVINQPAYGAREVASHALAMLLGLHRRLAASDAFVRRGWTGPLDLAPMPPLDELTLGLVGCGRIGAETARMATPFVDRVLVHDPYASVVPHGVQQVATLHELLAHSHLLSLHTPLTAETRGMIGARELAALPAGAVVVNVSRGGVLDEEAAAELLHSGRLAGVGLDVYAHEPLAPDAAILSAPRTVLSPHVAAYSERSSWRLASWAIEDALCWLERRTVEHGALVVKGNR